MMKKQTLAQLLSVALVVSGCSKEMTLNTKAPVLAPTAKRSTNNSPAIQTPVVDKTAGLTGKLFPFSQFDMNKYKTSLLYLNASEGTAGVAGVGNPAYTVEGENDKAGFVKQSNLAFRGILHVTPVAAAMQKPSLKLVLHGVRFYNDGNQTADVQLAKQVLCIADKEVCAGGGINLSDANINGVWKSASLISASFTTMDQFKTKFVMKDGGKLYSFVGTAATTNPPATTPPTGSTSSSSGDEDVSNVIAGSTAPALPVSLSKKDRKELGSSPSTTGTSTAPAGTAVKAPKAPAPLTADGNLDIPIKESDFVIDIQTAFKIADADFPQWILDHSTAYDSTGNYRKFLFELGDNLYVRSGELKFDVTTDARVPLPTAMTADPGTPVNGQWDMNDATVDTVAGTQIDPFEIGELSDFMKALDSTKIAFVANADGTEKLDDASIAKITQFASTLIKFKTSLKEVHITGRMDIGTDPAASIAKGLARANIVANELSALQVTPQPKVAGTVIKVSTCGATTPTCPKDQAIGMGAVFLDTLTLKQANKLKNEIVDGLVNSFPSTTPAVTTPVTTPVTAPVTAPTTPSTPTTPSSP